MTQSGQFESTIAASTDLAKTHNAAAANNKDETDLRPSYLDLWVDCISKWIIESETPISVTTCLVTKHLYQDRRGHLQKV